MSKNVLVVADLRQGTVRNVTFEALTAARQLSAGGEISALLIGKGVSGLTDILAQYGAEHAYIADDPMLEFYTPDGYSLAVDAALAAAKPDVILFAHSAIGRDLAPIVAAKLGAGQVSDITSYQVIADDIHFTRPIYAGKAFTSNQFVQGPIIATLRPNNFPIDQPDPSRSAEIRELSIQIKPNLLRSFVRETVRKTAAGVDLSEAKIIVSGGRGVKSSEGFAPLKELAAVLGAAVGASRGACDANYCDYSMQIGQTGKVVTPDLYIACGISGAIQHVAGMSGSKVIVAINKDPEAPIFKIATYGIVGDLFQVVPLLTEEFKRVLGQ